MPPQPFLDAQTLHRLVAEAALLGREGGLDRALEIIRRSVEADTCELYVRSPDGEAMVLTGLTGHDYDAFCELELFRVGEGFPGLVARHGQPVTTIDLAADKRYLRERVKGLDYTSYAAEPVGIPGHITASLQVAWKGKEVDMSLARSPLQTAASILSMGLLGWESHSGGRFAQTQGVGRPTLAHCAAGIRAAAAVDRVAMTLSHQNRVLATATAGRGPGGDQGFVACATCPARKKGGATFRYHSAQRPCPVLVGSGAARALCLPFAHGDYDGIVLLSHLDAHWTPTAGGLPEVRALLDRMRFLWPGILANEAEVITVPNRSRECGLRVETLGTTRAFVDGAEIPTSAFKRAKSLELLAILAGRVGKMQHRWLLIDKLWPDREPDSCVGRFNNVLHSLRSALEPGVARSGWRFIEAAQQRYGLRADLCASDVSDNRDSLALAKDAEPDVRLSHLESVVDRYRGTPYGDYPEAVWCLADRESLRAVYVDSLVALYEGGGRAAPDHLLRAAAMDPKRADVQTLLVDDLRARGRLEEADWHELRFQRRETTPMS